MLGANFTKIFMQKSLFGVSAGPIHCLIYFRSLMFDLFWIIEKTNFEVLRKTFSL